MFQTLNMAAFYLNKSNSPVTKEAATIALKRKADEIAVSIAGNSVVNGEDQLQHDKKSLALHKLYTRPEIQKMAKTTGLFPLDKMKVENLTFIAILLVI